MMQMKMSTSPRQAEEGKWEVAQMGMDVTTQFRQSQSAVFMLTQPYMHTVLHIHTLDTLVVALLTRLLTWSLTV